MPEGDGAGGPEVVWAEHEALDGVRGIGEREQDGKGGEVGWRGVGDG